MNRKTIERNQAKYDAGLRKRLLANHDMSEWDHILEEAKHHIVRNQLPIMESQNADIR